MQLDGLTLIFAGTLVSGVGALMLLGAWLTQLRAEKVISWWAAAYVVNALGLAGLMSGIDLASPALIAAGCCLLPIAAAGMWTGVRAFHGRDPAWAYLATVPLAWLALNIPPLANRPLAAALILSASLFAATAVELWRGRHERRIARWPLAAIVALHAVVFAASAVSAALGGLPASDAPVISPLFGLIFLEEVVFLLSGGVLMMMMCRERQEALYVAAARIDSLTGVANRGAFFHYAQRIVNRSREDAALVAMVAFDLDHFKSINDTHGHAVGDQVLKAFADTAGAVLRPGDLFGRTGGEEFAALLPGAGEDAAAVIADRVRHAVAAVPRIVNGAAVRVTVSAGVAGGDSDATVATMLEAADRALYRAKRAGRNRVERASDEPLATVSNVVRIA